MSNNVLPDPLNTNPVSKDFFIEVARGNVPGHTTRAIVMRSKNIVDLSGGGFRDIWGIAGNLSYPTANETWEIVSTDAADTSAGTGAQTVLVNYLDEDYVQQFTIVSMNGITAVTLNSDMFRPDGAVVIGSGSGRMNAGDITIQVSGGGAPRQFIEADFSASEDSQYTVPAGKSIFAINAQTFWKKNEDGDIRGMISPLGTNTDIVSGNFPAYQSSFNLTFETPPMIGEKTDTSFRARSTTNAGPIEVSFALEFIIIDNVIP